MIIKTFVELENEYGKEIPYYELLTCDKWRLRRNSIIARDRNKCTVCSKEGPDDYSPRIFFQKGGIVDSYLAPIKYGVEEVMVRKYVPTLDDYVEVPELVLKEIELKNITYLHVHHKYYIHGKYPWDYPDSALVTVCSGCHQKIHDSEVVPVYLDYVNGEKMQVTPCTRCQGQGVLPQFYYYFNGICFKCGGAKYQQLVRNIDRIDWNN